MSGQQLAQKQYEQAKEAAEKLEDWRLREIRHQMRIDPPVKNESLVAKERQSSRKS
jgi:hypothetical protein